MATRYNNRKLITSQQTIPIGKLLPGMIVTFNYSEEGVIDPRPILLFLYNDREKKLIEGLNINYINPAKIKKLFQVMDVRKIAIVPENLIELRENYFRVQLSVTKRRSRMTPKRFYSSVVLADNSFKKAYRSYKTNKLSALKVVNIKKEFIHKPGGDPTE